MKRRLGLLLAAVTLAVSAGAASPASAVPIDICVGQGRAVLTKGLNYPSVVPTTPGTKNASAFTFSFTTGKCIFLLGSDAAGTLTGYCGQFEGKGTTENGRPFVFTTLGGIMVITGEFAGIAYVLPDPTISNNSCLNKTATNLIVVLVMVETPCSITLLNSKGKSLTVPSVGNIPLGDLQTNVWLCV